MFAVANCTLPVVIIYINSTVNHFVDLNKKIDIGHGTQHDVQEVDFKRWEEEIYEENGLKIDRTLTG